MYLRNRREFIKSTLFAAGAAALWPLPLHAAPTCNLPHPLNPPDPRFQGQCPNCGMVRAMWARTWVAFENAEGKSEACSLHCLADVARKSGEDPRRVQVAIYDRPQGMNPAETVFFVVGSSARGTMTRQSKIAFANQKAASGFIRFCGGRVKSFEEAFTLARQSVVQENKMIAVNRLQKKKIVEPIDNQDRCPVCDMYPARYPRHKCQIHSQGQPVYHFCSTQCLFNFLNDSAKYAGRQVAPFLIWVVDYETQDWVSARTSYYVVGSAKLGPMGGEALAFDQQARAEAFVRRNGGSVMLFGEVKPGAIQ